jgi:peptidoglycan/xylan/chitin deacetylase (PgdA/CDA1 family)
VLGVTPTTFIPPENLYNNDTIAALKQNNFTQISYHTATNLPPSFKKSDFYHFPATTQTSILNRQEANWNVQSIDKVYDEINDSLLNYGYAVVMMHPHEFSTYSDGIYQNKVNQTNVQHLGLLIDKVRNEGLKIVTINEISSFDKPIPKKQTSANTTSEAINCNCVAFRLDNIQDYYLNDVQKAIIDKFDEKKSPLTISIIGKFFGTDPKTVNLIKEKIDGGSPITVANRGWEYLDHTAYDKQKQAASIQKTNDHISKILGVKSVMFVPPLDSFNKDTILAASQNNVLFFSSSVTRDPPPYSDSLKHIPSTSQFVSLVDDDPFYSGTIPQKAQAKIKSSIEKYGYAVIGLQPQDFATKNADNTSKNEIDANMLKLLGTIIDDLKSNGVSIVNSETIPSILEEKSIVIPSWVQENAGWWADDKIADSDFTKGLQYLIDQKIVKIPSTQAGNGATQKIPNWIKNNAGWWAEGKIGNSDFVKGIQYLIANGIIRI